MTRDTAKLFAAVYANPDADAPRSVLADALQEAGDPRGEFIALQLARARGGKKTRRESQLLKPNQRAWLGPLVMAIPNKGLVFERGFVARCQLQHHRESIEPYLGHPEWATVEEVQPGAWDGTLQPLADALPSLRLLTNLELGTSIPSHPKLEKVAVSFFNDDHVDHVIALRVPALRELAIRHCNADLPAIERLCKGMKQVAVSVHVTSSEAAFIAAFATRKLGTVARAGNCWRLRFEGNQITAEYWWYDAPASTAGQHLADMLRHVPKPERWHVTIGREIPVPRGLAMRLNKFASHAFDVPA